MLSFSATEEAEVTMEVKKTNLAELRKSFNIWSTMNEEGIRRVIQGSRAR